ncbi:MAG: S8 family serine peptidase [Candidatus Eisenbacteria bacterium]|nr:S8 family serine peptidase [Candidatus Eisenbacteria bacterium]
MTFLRVGLAILCMLALGAAAQDAPGTAPAAGEESQDLTADGKVRITKQDDLPRHTYEVPGTVTELLSSPEDFAALARQVRADIETDLETYEIEDATALKTYHNLLMTLDVVAQDYDAALQHVERIRALEDKPAARMTAGLTLESRVAAIRAAGGPEVTPEFREVFRREYRSRVEALPWGTVQDHLQATKGQLEMLSRNLLLGVVQQQIDPAVKNAGHLSLTTVQQVAGIYWLLNGGLDTSEDVITVLDDVIEANREEKRDIWTERSVDLAGEEDLAPVLIAIWDTGLDPEVFAGRVWTNEAEVIDGEDNDGNGFVDDRHGVAYDTDWRKTTEILYPMDAATRDAGELEADFKGYSDLQSAVESPEAAALRQRWSEMEPDQVKSIVEDLGHYTLYCHGTHVAGIAVEGNPAATILAARLTADVRMMPDPPTMEKVKRGAQAYRDVIDYFKDAGVRVVNMSWVVPRSSFEQELEMHGIGDDAEERKAMAREMFEVGRKALYEAMRDAEEILFVGGAGNSDNDVTFDEFYPPMFDLPNLLIAGAVDQAGDATSFTSFGSTVNVYSNGFEVDSYVPGGNRMKLSGTSMASPNVVNLAAKLFALEPSLTPAEVAALIVEGADERQEGDRTLRIINPARTVALLEQ